MNGVHDMGGMQGMGPIRHENHEPAFHERWEGRVYALSRVLRTRGGCGTSMRFAMASRFCRPPSTSGCRTTSDGSPGC